MRKIFILTLSAAFAVSAFAADKTALKQALTAKLQQYAAISGSPSAAGIKCFAKGMVEANPDFAQWILDTDASPEEASKGALNYSRYMAAKKAKGQKVMSEEEFISQVDRIAKICGTQ